MISVKSLECFLAPFKKFTKQHFSVLSFSSVINWELLVILFSHQLKIPYFKERIIFLMIYEIILLGLFASLALFPPTLLDILMP